MRRGDLGYPSRAVRTKEFLYIRNFRPDRWPAGNPEMYFAVGEYRRYRRRPDKDLLLARPATPAISKFAELAMAKRPAEELSCAGTRARAAAWACGLITRDTKKDLRAALDKWMRNTADPRISTDDDRWDTYPYFGNRGK